MKTSIRSATLAVRPFAAGLLLASAASALAAVHYVDVNNTNPTPPYTNWPTAATNIQDAVDAAVADDEIVVTNGTYATGGHVVGRVANRVAVDKPLNVRSINGPQFTTIAGGRSRCVYLTNGASLFGFTLTNGLAGGGGLSDPSGGGGGAYGGTLSNCTLTGNGAEGVGGGACNSTLNNGTLTGNNTANYGGGAYGCTLNNCTLTGNSAGPGSGGGAYGGTLNNCIVYFNTATNGANFSLSEFVAVLNYCCTTPQPTSGVGNITNEPAFVNPAAGNYRLRPDSPCIDAGTNLSASITNDLDGRPRPLDGNGDGLAAFDMGACEYRTPLLVWQGSPNPTSPHADWATAAHTIQDAVDAAVAGDEIVVTNGNYATGSRAVNGYPFGYNRVAVDKPLSIRSINGPQSTTIQAGNFPTDLRCVYLTNGASLSGFTLARGCSRIGGGAYGGTLNNCTLTRNTTYCGAESYDAYGGGAVHCTLNNCTLTGNSVVAYGRSFGGGAASCTLNNCTLTGNSAYNHSLSSSSEAYGGGASGCTLNNCTLSDNSFGFTGAQRFGGGAYQCTLSNCIVYFNSGANYYSCALNYSCTTPPPTSGVGNITNAPLFVDSNLRLQSNSPCINAGNKFFRHERN